MSTLVAGAPMDLKGRVIARLAFNASRYYLRWEVRYLEDVVEATVLYIFFKPDPKDARDTDLELPEWAYDNTPRDADEMVKWLYKAVTDVTKDWDIERMEAWLAIRALDSTPKDEIQTVIVSELLDRRRENVGL